jgi:lysylphosphatidylglycerol synthetase-like protein (DUF2156 family)
MPAVVALGKLLQATQQIQSVIFILGLVVLFFAPFLMFVVGETHLTLRSNETSKKVYWSSLAQVGLRSLAWLLGCGVGFALFTTVRNAPL